jgi:hypothetical protein
MHRSCLTIIQARNDRYYVRLNNSSEQDKYLLLPGEKVFEYADSISFFCLEENCDIYRKYSDKFIGKEYVFKAIDPDHYIRCVREEIDKKHYKDYTEMVLHYGGQTVAEEVFYRKRPSML